MIYTKSTFIPYPSRSIIEDVLMRDSPASTESFTPFDGLNYMIKEQLGVDASSVSIKDILASCTDFNPDQARATAEKATARDVSAIEVKRYYRRLEEIDQSYINKYINNILVGFKKNKTRGLRELKQNDFREVPLLEDVETGDTVIASDLEEKEVTFSTDELYSAKIKLPYLLKQLHDESIKMGGSLLSVIIALEKLLLRHKDERGYDITPREMVALKIYKVDANGNTTSTFDISENTRNPLRNLLNWAAGNQPESIGWKAYQELVRVVSVLDIDLTKEDPRNYTKAFIDASVCTYLASNEEYMDSYGKADPKIINLLEPGKLFSVIREEEEKYDVNAISTNERFSAIEDSIASNIEQFFHRGNVSWVNRPKAVDDFLTYYFEFKNLPKKSISNYRVDRGLLKRADGRFISLDVTQIINRGLEWCIKAVVSSAGYLIVVEDFEDSLRYISVEEAILRFKGEIDRERYWNRIYF